MVAPIQGTKFPWLVAVVLLAASRGAYSQTILFTADTQGFVGEAVQGVGGLERRAALLSTYPAAMRIDGGNAFFGAGAARSNGEAMVAAYEAMRYDAVNISYRDFRLGKDATLELLKGAKFTAVSANLKDAATKQLLFKPFHVRDIGGKRVAVVGVTQKPAGLTVLPQLKRQFKGIQIDSPVDALRQWAPAAKKEADLVLLIYYGSLFELAKLQREFADLFDGILGGGIRPTQLKTDQMPSPVVAVDGAGRSVAQLILGKSVEQLAIDRSLDPAQEITDLLQRYVPKTQLVGTPLVGRPTESTPAITLPEMYVRESQQTGIELRGPWYQGDPFGKPPKHWQASQQLWRATGGGRYKTLLRKLKVVNDGKNRIYGFAKTEKYREYKQLPPGYWVYAAPYWYIWKDDRAPRGPYLWRIRDIRTGKSVAYGEQWSTLKAPPGVYRVTVRSWYGEELTWKERVEVLDDHVTTVVLRSGVQVETPADSGVTTFSVFEPSSGQLVARPLKTFAPLLPGVYRLRTGGETVSGLIDWGDVEVREGQVTRVPIANGIRFDNTVDDARRYWFDIKNIRTGEIVAISERRGAVPLLAGRYELMLRVAGGAPSIPWGQVNVESGKYTDVVVNSGVSLERPDPEPERLDRWSIFDARTKTKVLDMNAFKSWGYAPIPPGEYFATANIEHLDGLPTKPFRVEAGRVSKLTLRDLGFARVDFETVVGAGAMVAARAQTMDFWIVQGDRETKIYSSKIQEVQPRYVRWAPHVGQAILRARCPSELEGDLDLEIPIELTAGATTTVDFPLVEVVKRHDHQLSRVQWTLGDSGHAQGRIVIMNATGDRVLGYRKNPPRDLFYLATKNSIVRVKEGSNHSINTDLPSGKLHTIEIKPKQLGPAKGVRVDVAIESPLEGQIVRGETTTVVGQASTEGPAGATRIAIVMDVSASAASNPGADLDGDGKPESVIDTEVAGAKLLLQELMKVEQRGPGTAFQVCLIRFYDGAEIMAPLTPLTDPNAETVLSAALDKSGRDGGKGSTSFPNAIKKAMQAFAAAEKPAPSVILFLTDGRGAGLDIAGTAGLNDITVHTIGMGREFADRLAEEVIIPRSGSYSTVEQLSLMAAVSGIGGTVWLAPDPSKVLDIIPQLPIKELPDAALKEVQLLNATTGERAKNVQLDRHGFFRGELPVSLAPQAEYDMNRIVVTAIAKDGVSQDQDEVRVRGELPWAQLRVVRDKQGDAAAAPSIEFVLDASGSMNDRIEGRPKYVIARQVMFQLLGELPKGSRVGLRLFGHLGFAGHNAYVRENDPRLYRDTELLVRIGPFDRAHRDRVRNGVASALPRGMTPLVYSLLAAKADFARATDKSAKLVILVSDGKENCGGKLKDVAEAYRNSNVDYTIHVVGLDINDSISRRKLQRIAQYGGGLYHDANNADQLTDVLRVAVRRTGFLVSDEENQIVGRGVVNGPSVQLKPGSYSVRMSGSEQSIAIKLGANEKRELQVDSRGNLQR